MTPAPCALRADHRDGCFERFPGPPPLEPLLQAVLAAVRAGTLATDLRRRPRLARWAARRLLGPVHCVAGDAVPAEATEPDGWLLLLRATLARLRPDGRTFGAAIAREDWLDRSAWRPWLALSCHYGLRPVERFVQRYRPREDDAVADQLAGLWDLAPSSVYRHIERGRQLLLEALQPAWCGASRRGPEALAFDAALMHELAEQLDLCTADERDVWHARQVTLALGRRDGRSALWHAVESGNAAAVADVLQRCRVELAADADTAMLLARHRQQGRLGARDELPLDLAVAELARQQGDAGAELDACERALHRATLLDDPLWLGRVYAALARHHELRDGDRALACLQESAEFLRQAGAGDAPGAVEAWPEAARLDYLGTLIQLAWAYLMRNDPRSQAVLERAEALRGQVPPESPALAMLEQCWGESWRRQGQLERSIECRFRALHRYERLGDAASVLKTYVNLTLVYGEAGNHPQAIAWAERVIALAQRQAVAPETLASTWLNLGASQYFQARYDQAIAAYDEALRVAQAAGLRVLVGRAHYNLAEAYYKRYVVREDPADEHHGDVHAAAALAAWPPGGDSGPEQATRRLKQEVLGTAPTVDRLYDRLLPVEIASHRREMDAVLRHRDRLALPMPQREQAREHLAIAQAYLEMAVREREAALGLMSRSGRAAPAAAGPDDEALAPLLARLRETFERSDGPARQRAARWRLMTAGWMPGEQAERVLSQLVAPGAALNKSGYAGLCGVSLATASKQLGRLAELGLVEQLGRGPATRYRLAGEAGAGG